MTSSWVLQTKPPRSVRLIDDEVSMKLEALLDLMSRDPQAVTATLPDSDHVRLSWTRAPQHGIEAPGTVRCQPLDSTDFASVNPALRSVQNKRQASSDEDTLVAFGC